MSGSKKGFTRCDPPLPAGTSHRAARYLAPAEAPNYFIAPPGNRPLNVGNEKTQSLWMDLDPIPAPRLAASVRTDVAVIGGGIAGLSIAYELIERGLSVAVVDRGKIGRGMTARTTAHLSPICDDGCGEII